MGLLDRLFGKDAPVAAEQSRPKSHRVFEVYEDAGGKWRWRVLAINGATVGTSGESFHTEGNALRAAKNEVAFYIEGTASVTVKKVL